MSMDYEQNKRELEAMQEQTYPAHLQDLADHTGEPIEEVQRKIEVIARHNGVSKHNLLELLNLYHCI